MRKKRVGSLYCKIGLGQAIGRKKRVPTPLSLNDPVCESSGLAQGCSGQPYMPGVRGSQAARLSGNPTRWQGLGKLGSEQPGQYVRRNAGNGRFPAGRFLRVPLKSLAP